MNSACFFLVAFVVIGAVSGAYVSGPGYTGTGFNGCYGPGYSATSCGPTAVYDTCHCVKTIVRPAVIEQIPYRCSRRIQTPRYPVYPSLGGSMYPRVGLVDRAPTEFVETRPATSVVETRPAAALIERPITRVYESRPAATVVETRPGAELIESRNGYFGSGYGGVGSNLVA